MNTSDQENGIFLNKHVHPPYSTRYAVPGLQLPMQLDVNTNATLQD